MSEETGLLSFVDDTRALGKYVADFVTTYFPSYAYHAEEIEKLEKENSLKILNEFTFYRIAECSIYNVENKLEYFSQKMQRLFTTAYAMERNVCYGVASEKGKVSLLIGISTPSGDDDAIKKILEGLLPGISLEKRNKKFKNSTDKGNKELSRHVGCISGIPALKVDGNFVQKDLASLIRSLNGFDYTIMVMCYPICQSEIQNMIDKAIQIQDGCFAISKRTLSRQEGNSTGITNQEGYGTADGTVIGKNKGINVSGSGVGAAGGAAIGAAVGSVVPGIGTAVGAIGGGLIGLIAGKQVSFNAGSSENKSHTITESYSTAVSDTITKNESISGEIQNGYAIDLMKMAESEIERLKIGRSIGMWQSVISYSSDAKLAADIIKGSLYSEVASGIPEVLPPVIFEFVDSTAMDKADNNQQLIVPKGFFEGKSSKTIQSFVTSEEICGICTIPTDETFGFEVKESKGYAINSHCGSNEYVIGNICEYDRVIPNMQYGLGNNDLNKHVFVCGITGSGKTNSVKSILSEVSSSNIPFLVIEPAKKEYRNIKPMPAVWTIGRPEINCPRINPFYIQAGISPQQHIDLLKELFSASFGFYGPMPYIMEKCLNNIYIKKGWNLSLGFHPAITSTDSSANLFDKGVLETGYSKEAHAFLFPTMQDLKEEIDQYVENELTYEGEVKGNIRGAIKSRIDSLCIGSKGYMFNTHAPLNMKDFLSKNTVMELEGLSDDGDKAFALGLLLIFVNEYRQIDNEINSANNRNKLKHILVVEEAHRLLKNVSTELASEDLGNSKGKAVETFTNILAEMRSYGQGVIVAEQIPSKLSPDVIKNSSNKIVHRLVAKDDQEAVANTIGINTDDAIYLGRLKSGYALCHKEGMTQPVTVKINEYKNGPVILDTKLNNDKQQEKYKAINVSLFYTSATETISSEAVRLLVSILWGCDKEEIYNGIKNACDSLIHKATLNGLSVIPGIDKIECLQECLKDEMLSLLTSGVFRTRNLLDKETSTLLDTIVKAPDNDKLKEFRKKISGLYDNNIKYTVSKTVAALFSAEYACGYNIKEYVSNFVYSQGDNLYEQVVKVLEETR